MDMGLDILAVLHAIVRRAMASLPGSSRGSLLMRDGERLVYRAAVGFEDAASGPLHSPSDAGPASAARALAPALRGARELTVAPAAEWYRAYPNAASPLAAGEDAGAGVLILPVCLHGELSGYLALEQPDMRPP